MRVENLTCAPIMAAEAELSPNETNKCNYEAGLVELIELMKASDFVAIDCTVETTGFLLPDETFNSAYMNDVENWSGSWYDNIKAKEKTHCLLEVGFAVFKRIPSHPMDLEVEAFNIPVLPACIDDNEIARFRGKTSVRLQFDGYGQEFIRQMDFDLNNVFYKGAPYLNRELQEQANSYMIQNPNFMVALRKRRLNRYLMPELFEEVGQTERKSIIERLKGVSKVFEAISLCKIPVVGHHLLLKLMFIYKDFFEYLPDTFPAYIEKIHKLFNVVYDTKQMASDLLKNPKKALSKRSHELLGHAENLTLYELIRNVGLCEDLIQSGYTLHVGARSQFYIEDLLDLMDGENVEEDSNGYCYVAGFDALACGALFLDLVQFMKLCNLDCEQGPDLDLGTLPSEPDYLKLFLTGEATLLLKNKIYKAPQLPMDKLGKPFLDLVQTKNSFWYQKRKQAQKEKEARARKLIVTTYKNSQPKA